ncbi:unnamed protein product [Ceratitis capitata]|uniref:(Mediterranean fruit fly) hypothetical protein n=1 Tax=Ceratitis capitata TaxID=7213 RepID=A0A811V3J1_CERCA|nr:unnamed protein product [Ceratitis capitata]
MVENYFNAGSSRRSYRSNSSQREFHCRPQFQQQKSTSTRNSCGPSTSTSAATARESYENCGCPQRRTSLSASSSPTRYSTSGIPKVCSNDLVTGAGMLATSTPQSSYTTPRNSCGQSAATLIQDPCGTRKTNSNASCCCCCPHCGKPQDPTQAPTPQPTCPPQKRTLPCRPKPQPHKEEKPSRKLQLQTLVHMRASRLRLGL